MQVMIPRKSGENPQTSVKFQFKSHKKFMNYSRKFQTDTPPKKKRHHKFALTEFSPQIS